MTTKPLKKEAPDTEPKARLQRDFRQQIIDVSKIKKRSNRAYIPAVQSARQWDPKTRQWVGAATKPSGLKGLHKYEITRKPVFREVDPGSIVVKKQVISAKTKKPTSGKKIGTKRKVAFEYTYADGTVYRTTFRAPSKAEINAFKSQKVTKEKTQGGHGHDPRELEADAPATLEFKKCMDVVEGGPVGSVRAALATLMGRYSLPPTGKFQIIVDWKVYADLEKKNILEASPSKRFTVNSKELHKGYRQFLNSIVDMKKQDLADDMGFESFDDVKEEFPDVVKAWKSSLKTNKDMPANTTRAFLEKQILALSQGRGFYISDQSYFRDNHKKGDKRHVETATVSELCIIIWRLHRAKPVKKKRSKKKNKKRGKRGN